MNFFLLKENNNNKGFGLVETLIAVTLFVTVSMAAYGGFTQLLKGLTYLEIKNAAITLANEKIEIARNLPYDDVGVVGGIPSGKLIQQEEISRGGYNFTVVTTVRNIDDEYDGTFEGSEQDESPNDYKLVQIDVSCQACIYGQEMNFYTRVSPQNLESAGQDGAIFVRVLDSFGQPLQGANINVFSNATTSININDVSDSEGYLKLYNIPPESEAYEITVSKNNYSTEQTYTTGDPNNPLPNKPHLNVVSGEVTSSSFAIDKLSYLSLKTREDSCSTVSNVDFNIHGSKTIGYEVYKFDADLNSGNTGRIDIEELEWDNYSIDLIDNDYELYGASSLFPIKVNPDTDQSVNLIVGDNDPNMLLVQVEDTSTGLPLSNAVVTLEKGSYDEEKTTGNGFINQTDWSGGEGQESYNNQTKFSETDNNIDYSVMGQLTLDLFSDEYVSDGYLESSIIDLGTTSNFISLNWLNNSQPASTTAKFQLATNEIINASTTWDFVGPDGDEEKYYLNSGESIYSGHSGDRYLKYKLFLETEATSSTPLISDVNFTYSSDCFAPGQVMFNGLDTGTYHLTVEREGYITYEILDLEVSKEWDLIKVQMTQ